MGRPKDVQKCHNLFRAFLAQPVGAQPKCLSAEAGCSESYARGTLHEHGVEPVLVTPLERAALAKMRAETLAAHFTPAPSIHGR